MSERNFRCPTCERLVPDKLRSIPEVQERLGVSRATVYRMLAEGELVPIKVRGGTRVLESSIESFLRRGLARYIEENS